MEISGRLIKASQETVNRDKHQQRPRFNLRCLDLVLFHAANRSLNRRAPIRSTGLDTARIKLWNTRLVHCLYRPFSYSSFRSSFVHLLPSYFLTAFSLSFSLSLYLSMTRCPNGGSANWKISKCIVIQGRRYYFKF